MTVRLSSLFEALWARMPVEARSTRTSTRRAPRRERVRERERERERDRERDRVRARARRVRPHRRAREPRGWVLVLLFVFVQGFFVWKRTRQTSVRVI